MKLEACVTKQEHFLRGAAFSPNYHDFWQGTVYIYILDNNAKCNIEESCLSLRDQVRLKAVTTPHSGLG